MVKIFVSYAHADCEWVRRSLVPVLKAAGVEVRIDYECLRAARQVVGEMDRIQDQAAVHALVVTQASLASEMCRHAMRRALACDPAFEHGRVVLLRRDEAGWPESLQGPVHVDLCDDQAPLAWKLLLDACHAELGAAAPAWLAARDEVERALRRDESVNLVVSDTVEARPLVRHLQQGAFPELGIVDLESGTTVSRPALLGNVLAAWGSGSTVALPPKNDDLVHFTDAASARAPGRIAFLHFDYAIARQAEYGVDLFAALKHLNHTERRLILLIESRRPFAELVPDLHSSPWTMKTVRLPGWPKA